MNCANCGKSNPDDARFCDGCGATLGGAVQQTYTPPAPPPPAPAYQQPSYQQPVYQQPGGYAPTKDTSPLSMGQYIGMFILSGIPIVGFILLLVWAFGSDTNVNKKNYARAVLLLGIIAAVLAIILSIALGGLMTALFSGSSYY